MYIYLGFWFMGWTVNSWWVSLEKKLKKESNRNGSGLGSCGLRDKNKME